MVNFSVMENKVGPPQRINDDYEYVQMILDHIETFAT